MAVGHTGFRKKIEDILTLREKEAGRGSSHDNSKKMVESTEVSHAKLMMERGNNVVKKRWRRGGEHNVIDIEKEVSSVRLGFEDEGRRVRMRGNET